MIKQSLVAVALSLALAACDGADIGDGEGGVFRPHVEDPHCDESGVACVWLGLSGEEGFNGDGRHRLDTKLYWSFDMIFAADGTPWFIDWNNHLVRKVHPNGAVETVVGWIDPVFPGDGESTGAEKTEEGAIGTELQLNHPTDLAQLPDGTILLMAWHNHKLRSIDPDTGRVKLVGGAGGGFHGDGMDVSNVLFKQPDAVQLDELGNIYIADQQNQRVRRIGQDGIVETIAGTGTPGFAGDDGPAIDAQFNWEVGSNPEPSGGLAYGDGILYVADTLNHRVRAIDLEFDTITTVAGNGEAAYAGDGGPAVEASLASPHDLEIGPDGDLYITDTDNGAIRAVDLDSGTIRTVAGTGELGMSAEDGLLATDTLLRRPFGIAFDGEGHLYIMDTINSRILRVAK